MNYPKKFLRKGLQVEAMRFKDNNLESICCWANQGAVNVIRNKADANEIEVFAREGSRIAQKGDWIVRGVNGSFFPCRDAEFRNNHEVIKNDLLSSRF